MKGMNTSSLFHFIQSTSKCSDCSQLLTFIRVSEYSSSVSEGEEEAFDEVEEEDAFHC